MHIPAGTSDLLLAVLFGLNITDILGTTGSGIFICYSIWKWSWEVKKKRKEENNEK